MNLFWLRYISYAFVFGAVFFYFAIRLNRLYISRARKVLLYVACIVMACVTWYLRESNVQQHSPRRLVMGTVVDLRTSQRRSGSVRDTFRLRLDSGAMSPEFSAHLSAAAAASQPIRAGDYVGVLYRTWDNVLLTLDELQGQNVGWHYSHSDDAGASSTAALALAGLVGLISAAVASRGQVARERERGTVVKLSE